MLPLTFPNSGIRVKGRPPACCLHAEVVEHSQAPCSGGCPWPSYLQGATGCGQGPLQRGGRLRPRPARKGATPSRSHTAKAAANSLQTVDRRKAAYGQRHRPQGLPPVRATACKGDRQQGLCLQVRCSWTCRL
ncbi:hypothetical protein GW17_00057653 [Ensete ventricosum]|nr:hypothetical protein GW17_00057653 [Ensete ventricosum]